MKAPFQVHWQAPFPANVCGSGCKALRWRLQCFALAIAKLCVGRCNALRWWMQCFASMMSVKKILLLQGHEDVSFYKAIPA